MYRPPKRQLKKQWGNAARVNKREDAKREERERQQNQKYIDAINAIADQLAADQQQNNAGERKRAFREKLTIFLVFATFLAAGIGDWFFYGQREEMVRAYGPLKDSAVAAEKSARTADDTAKRQLRAYVLYADNAIKLSADGSNYQVSMSIKNRGQTVAYSVTYWWNSDIRDIKGAPTLVRQVQIPETGDISSDIDPSGEWPIEQEAKPISDADLADIRNGTKAFFVWGIIKYRDVFLRCQYVNFLVKSGREVTPHQWHFDVIQVNNITGIECNTWDGNLDHAPKAKYP